MIKNELSAAARQQDERYVLICGIHSSQLVEYLKTSLLGADV